MKTLFIHLSDLHLKNNEYFDVGVAEGFAKSLNGIKCEKVTILFTGDLVNSGTNKEMESFERLISYISSSLKNVTGHKPNIICVPGNHDRNPTVFEPTFEDILGCEKDNDKHNKMFDEYIKSMTPFFKYANKNNCFVERKSISHLEDELFNYILVNSSPFSLREYADKEHHYIPFNRDGVDIYPEHNNKYLFLLCHHRPDWFEYNTSSVINDFIKDACPLCLFGHEHKQDVAELSFSDNKRIIVVFGGELFVEKGKLIGSFNTILVNDEGSCELRQYCYKKNVGVFVPEGEKKIFTLNQFNYSQTISSKTIDALFSLEVENKIVDQRDFFVMPYIRSYSKEFDDIYDFDGLIKTIEKSNNIFISSPAHCGKTILAYKILEHFNSSNKKCVYISASEDELSNNCESEIKKAIFKLYGNNEGLYEYIKQLPKEDKVIIFDDFHSIKSKTKRNAYLDFINEFFGIKILFSSYRVEQTNWNKQDFSTFSLFSICGFSIKQRREFVEKICDVFGLKKEETINDVLNATSISLANCSTLDMSSPYLLLALVVKIISDKLYINQKVSNAFSLIFEMDINNSLSLAGRKEDLESYLLVLSEVAFAVYKRNDETFFTNEELASSLRKCKDDYKNIFIDFDEILDIFLKSKIIKKSQDDTYRFQHNSYLAYFVSQKIVELFREGDKTEIAYLCDNIVEGLNGDIFLFVIYELNQVNVLYNIKNTLDEALQSYEEINLEKRNNPILKKEIIYKPETKQQAESKKQMIERLDTGERKRINTAHESEQHALDKKEYDEDDALFRTLQKAWKLLEVLAKSTSGFNREIKANKRIELMKFISSMTFKILYATFDISEEVADELIKFFEDIKAKEIENAKAEGKSKQYIDKINEFSFQNFMYDRITTSMLNAILNVCKLMLSDASVPFISELDDADNDFCHKMFQLSAYELTGKIDLFMRLFEDVYTNKKTSAGNKYLMERIMRVFIIRNNVSSSVIDKLVNITKKDKVVLLRYKYN